MCARVCVAGSVHAPCGVLVVVMGVGGLQAGALQGKPLSPVRRPDPSRNPPFCVRVCVGASSHACMHAGSWAGWQAQRLEPRRHLPVTVRVGVPQQHHPALQASAACIRPPPPPCACACTCRALSPSVTYLSLCGSASITDSGLAAFVAGLPALQVGVSSRAGRAACRGVKARGLACSTHAYAPETSMHGGLHGSPAHPPTHPAHPTREGLCNGRGAGGGSGNNVFLVEGSEKEVRVTCIEKTCTVMLCTCCCASC
jgi:hypothetical protein